MTRSSNSNSGSFNRNACCLKGYLEVYVMNSAKRIMFIISTISLIIIVRVASGQNPTIYKPDPGPLVMDPATGLEFPAGNCLVY